MWKLLVLLDLVVLACAETSAPPNPINVVFSSVNLRNVLQWTPVNGTPENTLFTVQYAIYGDTIQGSKGTKVHWRAVQHCTDIVRTWCDLSNETWDEQQGYHAKVRAVGRREWATTRRRFDPKLDTILGPPLVSVEMEGNNVIIHMRGPMRYDPDSHTTEDLMARVYPQMMYNLSVLIYGKTHYLLVGSSVYTYQLTQYNTKYCFSARTRLLNIPLRCQSSELYCVIAPQDPQIVYLQKVVLGILVPSLGMCAIAVVAYFLHYYLMGKGQKSHMLNSPSLHPPPLTFSPEKLNINLVIVSVISDASPSDRDGIASDYARVQRKSSVSPPSGYSPQRQETPPDPGDLSVDYGFVGAAPAIGVSGEKKASEMKRDNDDGNNLNGKPPKCIAREGYEKKEWAVGEGHHTRVYAGQPNAYLLQTTGHTRAPAHSVVHSQTPVQTEMSTHVKAQSWSQLRTQAEGGTNRELENGEVLGLLRNTEPQNNVFLAPSYRQTNQQGVIGVEMDREVQVRPAENTRRTHGERRESETVALLSGYASQSTRDRPAVHDDQADCLPDDYGLLTVDAAYDTERKEDEEDDEGGLCLDWDPGTRRLVFPEFNGEAGFDAAVHGGGGSRGKEGGEASDVRGRELKLENVFVRQGSEEEKAMRRLERGGTTDWEVEDLLTKWNVVLSMDQ